MNLRNIKKIYMIGIGGISMSGIAEILKTWNFTVLGSDQTESKQTEYLKSHGINVIIGQNEKNITPDIDLIVYTAAIKKDNPELIMAAKYNIKTMERGVFLGELTKLFRKTIGIAGTHGKTTTTSMVANIFLQANLDPTIQVGAFLEQIGANYKVGKSEYFIIEACEYCDSFLNFQQESAIVLNIDNDHLDYFKNMDNMQKSYEKYVTHLPSNGVLVINNDDERCQKLKQYTTAKVITVGKKDAIWTYQNVTYNDDGYPEYDAYYNNEFYAKVHLMVNGTHNILNSLCSIALSDFYQIKKEDILSGLKIFTGASRRMEYKGTFMGAKVYDDYAHHPTEVMATAKAVKEKKFNRSWVIFECHSYSRLKDHLKEFAKSLSLFDNIIIAPIYAAREQNIYNIYENDLIDELHTLNKESIFLKTNTDIINYLKTKVQENDLILTMGAGKINILADELINYKGE